MRHLEPSLSIDLSTEKRIDWAYALNPDLVGPWDEVYPTAPAVGYLYVMAFDSGWTRLGLTTNWPKRRRPHTSNLRTLGEGLLQAPWKSDVVPRTELEVIEKRLRAEAPVADCFDRTPRGRARLTLLAAIWRGKWSQA